MDRKSLHAIGGIPNPYEQAISIIGRTLSPFDDDNLIPCFGFGDVSTHDQYVFSFFPDFRCCHGFEEALARYREIVPYLKLAGPTSFAPIIDAAIDIVERSNWQYHVLVIIADGQVTRSVDLPPGRFSPQEQATINSIVAASQYPLSIVLVGVGDGPWDEMQHFDDNIPHRAFDNFQFVNFTKIMSENKEMSKKEAAFALAALMEIPFQYRATQSSSREGVEVGTPRTTPLPPPREVIDHDSAVKTYPHMTSFQPVEESTTSFQHVEPVESTTTEQVCAICLTNPKNMAFGCGHLTCKDCGANLTFCPMCREPIRTRIRLYS
ncbi:PREDICTED: E3 ubiquitin-protein ligase RGLG1-like isoform X2 [Nelumbo nucifera]|uniref:E3 ubiquitin-protein ligase RGLG1-like isoform X2 n=1 Tax=Nelumbo nucifera TaxID=4432 RepID=A0A1U8Q271_NELNU|nr:PREDICTED: E3 ubiquitin-protein ligase RGLG1-like isoform X2 [Nelumbo nucifera]